MQTSKIGISNKLINLLGSWLYEHEKKKTQSLSQKQEHSSLSLYQNELMTTTQWCISGKAEEIREVRGVVLEFMVQNNDRVGF